jgi:lipopolysaccharide/colanic/teichoic acid biosynthesis glycosyltransferase
LPEASTLHIYLRAVTAFRFHKRAQYRVKRVLDLFASIILLVLLAPLFLLIALSIKLTSRGPVFYKQQRLKQNGIEFTLFKFRTMVSDADARLEQVLHLNQASGPLFKLRQDPRTTRVGRFLRSTFLDELPQLLNVLRADMSLVGPRPILAREAGEMEKQFLFRFAVPQGITGPWQISGHYTLTIEDQLRAERDYVCAWSLRKDFVIVLRTIPLVLRKAGL